jgi:hypothetical protein
MPRPVGGSCKLTLQQVAGLPASGSASQFAKALGLSATTLRNWCLMEKLPYVFENKVYVIQRADLSKWLVETHRVADQ